MIRLELNYGFTLYAKQRKEVEEYSRKVFVDSHVVLTAPDKLKSEQKTKKSYKFLFKRKVALQYIWLVKCLLYIKVFKYSFQTFLNRIEDVCVLWVLVH